MAFRFTLTLQTLIALLAAFALTIGATSLIRANARTNIAEERIPLPVAVTQFAVTDSYERASRFIGTIRAANESSVGFEVGGQISEVLVTEGSRVAAGDVLATLDTERREAQLEGARARLAQVAADLALAEKRSVRVQELVTRGLASQQDLDDAVLGAESLRAARTAAEATALDAELQVSKSTLRAPYDAVVAERLAQPGAAVGAGSPILRLVTAERREAHIGMPVPASKALVPGKLYPLRLGQQRFEAPLRSLGDDVDPTTLTLGVVFELPDSITASVGESVQLSLRESVPASGGWLPLTSLIEGQRGLWTVLTVQREGGKAFTARESVEVIYVDGARAFVRGTLTNDAEVVATGLQRISPGSIVDPRPLEAFTHQGTANPQTQTAQVVEAG